MLRANRPLALALLLMAVVCSPAGVCMIGGVAAAVQAAPPAHDHSCCKAEDGGGTLLAAGDRRCCDEPGNGFVNVLRFTLQKQAVQPSLMVTTDWIQPTVVTDVSGFGRAAPLVLRI